MRLRLGDPVKRWMAVRPLALGAACFLLGLIAGRAAPSVMAWAIGAGCLAALLGIFRRKALIFALCVALGGTWISARLARPDAPERDDACLTGVVDSDADVTDYRVRVRLTGAALDGEPLPCKVMLYLYDVEDVPPVGATITATARTWQPADAGNPGGFDFGAWLWRQGVALCATSSAKKLVSIEPSTRFSLAALTQRTRAGVSSLIRETFDEDCADIVTALVIGDRSDLSEETWRRFRASGVAHLLALSGLHVGVLFAALEWLLTRLRLSRRTAFFTALPAMAAYALLVGAPASMLRACLMIAAAHVARLLGRPRDGASILCLAMLPLLIVNPLYIEDAGFVLSFSAVAGLLLFGRRIPLPEARWENRPTRVLKWFGQLARASFAAQIGTLPASACCFNQLPLWFLPFNVALGPLMIALYPLLLIVVIASAVCAPLGAVLAVPAQMLLRLFAAVTRWGAQMPLALVNAADWPAWLIALYAASAFLASPYARLSRRRAGKAAACAAMSMAVSLARLLPAITGHGDGGEITFLDVGEGDAAVVRTERKVYLIDTGDGDTAARYLLDHGLRPDGVFLSHGHRDHAGGLEALVGCFPPCPVYVSCAWDRDGLDESLLETWQSAVDAGWEPVVLSAGDELALSDKAVLRVWHPAPDGAAGVNENSMVCSVHIGDSAALFTGDLPATQELTALPDCTVLKVAHHGARTSTGPLLIEKTTPSIAVISVGHNSFGHPAPEVLERLAGAKVYRTDLGGAVTVTMTADGETRVETWKKAR